MSVIEPVGKIIEVDAPKPTYRQSQFDALYREIMLRLEQTPPRKALALPYPTRADADRMRDRLGVLVRRRLGAGVVRTSIHEAEACTYLLIWRGPKWKRGAG